MLTSPSQGYPQHYHFGVERINHEVTTPPMSRLFHHQFLLSVWRIGLEIMLLQDTLFAAVNLAATQDLKPIAILSFSTVLLHI